MTTEEEQLLNAEYCRMATWSDQIDFNLIVCAVCDKSVCKCRTADTIECAECHRNKKKGCNCGRFKIKRYHPTSQKPIITATSTVLEEYVNDKGSIVTIRAVHRSMKCNSCGKYWTSYEEIERSADSTKPIRRYFCIDCFC